MQHAGSWEYQDKYGHKYAYRQFYVALRDICEGEEIMHQYSFAEPLTDEDPLIEEHCAWFGQPGLSHNVFEALEFARQKFPGREEMF